MSTASPEAIDTAARVLWENGSSANPRPWDEAGDGLRSRYRFFATAALNAAAPIIAAKELRDAADALESHWAYGAELKSNGNEDRAIAAAMQMTHENAEELRARADQIDGKES